MSEQVLKEILDGINLINKRMDNIEKMIFDFKVSKIDPRYDLFFRITVWLNHLNTVLMI